MEEKFSVSLELMIQKFKDNAKRVQDVSKNVANKIKENMSVNIGGDTFKSMNAESELLLNKINDIKATLEMAKTDNKLFSTTQILEMNAELKKLENQYDKLNPKSNMFSNSIKNVQDSMSKSLRSAKRFTLSLFGIQSGISMISRAMSAYSSIDEESANKSQAAWIGLGSMFSWLKDIIANFTIKAVSYINVFIKALTGTDFLANAMAKSMNKASKNAGKLSKILAGFDELTNLDDSANGAGIDTSWIDAFKNVQLDPKITAFFQKLGEVMKPVYEGVIKVIDWFKQLDTTTQILIATLGSVGLLGLFFGPVGLIVGLSLLAAGVYTYFSNTKDAKKGTDDLKTAQERLKEATDNLKKANEDLSGAIDKYEDAVIKVREANERLAEAQNKTGLSGKDLYDKVNSGTISYIDLNVAQKEVYKLYLDTINAQNNLSTTTDNLNLLTNAQREAVQKQTDAYKKTIDQLEIANSRLNKNSEEFKNNQKQIDETKASLKQLTGENYSTSVEIIAKANTKQAEKDYDNFFSKLGRFVGSVVNPFEWGNIGKNFGNLFGGGYANGLDYVPFEGLYHLHPGETVVPAKFTPDMHGIGSRNNNQDVVNKIDELIYELRVKDMNAYITEAEVGKASQNYRTQQSRIMGEELI